MSENIQFKEIPPQSLGEVFVFPGSSYIWKLWTIIPPLIAVYLFFYPVTVRKPVLVEEPNRIAILDNTRVENSPIKIFDISKNEITGNVTAATFYFINRGREPILNGDITSPLKIKFASKDVRILDARVVKRTRELTNTVVTLDPLSLKDTIDINFKILEKNDGAAISVIFTGDPKTPVEVHGSVIDEPKFSLATSGFNIPLIFRILISLVSIAFAFLAALISERLKTFLIAKYERESELNLKKKYKFFRAVHEFVSVGIISGLFFAIPFYMLLAKPTQQVPAELRIIAKK